MDKLLGTLRYQVDRLGYHLVTSNAELAKLSSAQPIWLGWDINSALLGTEFTKLSPLGTERYSWLSEKTLGNGR